MSFWHPLSVSLARSSYLDPFLNIRVVQGPLLLIFLHFLCNIVLSTDIPLKTLKSGSFPSISTVSASPTLFQGLLIICWDYCFNLLIHSFQVYVTSHDGYIAIFLKCTSDCLLHSLWSKANPQKQKKAKNKTKYSSNLCSRAAMACRQAAGLCSVTLGICSHMWSTVNA